MAIIREAVSINFELTASGSTAAAAVPGTAYAAYTTAVSGSGDYSKHGSVQVAISGSMTLDGLASLVIDQVNIKEGVS